MTGLSWFVISVLIIINALYVAAEFAAVSVRRSKINELADNGNALARRLLPVLKDAARLDRYIAACQIGITISSLLLGAFGQARLAEEIKPYFISMGKLDQLTAQASSAMLVLISLTVLQVLFGELLPKSLALQYSAKTALFTVIPMRWSLSIFNWFITMLNGSGMLVLKVLGVSHGAHRHIHSPEEIDLLIAESHDGGILEDDEHHRLHEALQLSIRTAHELMVPRRYLSAVEIDTPLAEVIEQIGEGAYTRVPIYRENLDNIEGIVHAKELMLRYFTPEGIKDIREVMRPAVFVPENVTTDRLLNILREKHSHQAIVVDEYGGVEGLLTLEDVLSELLGEVGDEFKSDQLEPEVLADGRIRLPGLLPLVDTERLQHINWQGESDTVGGFITETLGRIPDEKEKVIIDGLPVVIETMNNNAIISIIVSLPVAEEYPNEEGN